MNCFYIAVYVSNLVNHGNKSHLGVFFSSAPARSIVYYMMNCLYDQDVSIYGVVWGVLLRMSLPLHLYDSIFILIYSILSPTRCSIY